MKLCGNPTGSRASIVWMQAAVVSAPAPHTAADADADADATADGLEMITPTESKWLSLQLGGAELQSPKEGRCTSPLLNLFPFQLNV